MFKKIMAIVMLVAVVLLVTGCAVNTKTEITNASNGTKKAYFDGEYESSWTYNYDTNEWDKIES